MSVYSQGKAAKTCDNPQSDRWVLTSFQIPPCKSCGGIVIVRVRRPGDSLAANDGFVFGDSTKNFTQNRVQQRVWSEYFPNATQLTLAFEVPASLINSVIFQGTSPLTYLDFALQDDTDVDYVQLLLGRW